MPTIQKLQGLSRSVEAGRSFVRFQFEESALNSFVEDLNYASTQGAIQSVTQLRSIGNQVLAKVKENFPQRKSLAAVQSSIGYRAIRPKSLNLIKGWRVNFYDAAVIANGRTASASASSLLGFYISHRQTESSRIRTILSSLESGSQAYRIYPVEKQSLRFPNGYPTATDQVFAKYADIPARDGFGFLAKAEAFADQILASGGSTMEGELVALLDKAHRFKMRALTTSSINRDAPDLISAAEESFSSAFAKGANPIKLLRSKKRSDRLKPRRFPRRRN